MALYLTNTTKHRKTIRIPFRVHDDTRIAFAWRQPIRLGVFGSGKAEPLVLDPASMNRLTLATLELTSMARAMDVYGSLLQAGASVCEADLDMGVSKTLYHADKLEIGKLDPLALDTNYLDVE